MHLFFGIDTGIVDSSPPTFWIKIFGPAIHSGAASPR
jgi:hypothetical protein